MTKNTYGLADKHTVAQAAAEKGELSGTKPLSKPIRWAIFAVGCGLALVLYAIWRDLDRLYGWGFPSGFLRGAVIFVGLLILWDWAKGKNVRPAGKSAGNKIASAPTTIDDGQICSDTPSNGCVPSDDDTSLYLIVAKELSANRRDEGLWTKAFACENGDERATKARYIRDRVDSLKSRSRRNDSGSPAAAPPAQQQEESAPAGAICEVAPWARFLARAIDLAVVAVVALTAATAMALTLPDWKMGAIPLALLGAAVFGVALLGYEAVSVSLLGTTIGKAVFGLRISAEDGGLLELKSAFRRAFWAWASGNACYFFFPALTTLFWWRGYKALTTTGRTSWDRKVASTVTQATIGSFRFFLGASLSVFLLSSSLVLSSLNKQTVKQELKTGGVFADLVAAPKSPQATAPRDPVAERDSLQKRANQGDAEAQAELAFIYGQGQGVPQDYAMAIEWYQRAAAQGNAAAQNNLGVIYREGQGVPKDYTKAIEWYQRAAAQGNAEAQNNLGAMYFDGLGVPRDYVLAYTWFNLAAAAGNENAVSNRSMIEQRMTSSQISEGQRLSASWELGKILGR